MGGLLKQVEGAEVVLETDSLAALSDVFKSNLPQLLFCDFSHARQLADIFAMAPAAPALVVVGGREHQAFRALQFGAFDFIAEPDVTRLALTLRKYRQLCGLRAL
ncbi:MAG: hypothetical protein LBL67_05310 [Coriobacteriales bacterium]|nr:hypothetical protein [Coriobacteriales bacterium]